MWVNRYIPLVAAAAVLGLSACGNTTEPTLIPIPDEISDASLVDVTAGEITEPSAFDLITATAVRTDQFSGWDFVFQIAEDGSTLLWPRAAIAEEDEDAGLRQMSVSFEALIEAPEGGYTHTDSVPAAVGDVFAVQSRRDPSFGSVRCRHYAKVEIMGIDTEERTMSFRHLVNPNCEKRKLVPGAEE